MTINWEAGKTEAIVIFRGKRQAFEKQSIQKPDGTRSLRVKLDTAADQVGAVDHITVNIVDG